MTTYTARDGRLYDGTGGATPNRDSLDDVMGLDAPPVRVEHAPNGDVLVTTLPDVHAPESLPDDDAELIREARASGWEPLSGFTGQYGYRGPILHPSEYIGGGLARHILETPGDYAVATADDPETGEPSGWVVLYRGPAGPEHA
jgi:hypothetical protein